MTEDTPLSQSNSILCSLLKMDPLTPQKLHSHEKKKEEKPAALLSSIGSIKLQPENKKNQRLAKLNSREIINCICGYIDEDGLMIQCEICLCWQHGNCNNIENEKDVPRDYVCQICQNPRRQHSSKKFSHTHHWFTEGRLPCFDVCKTNAKLLAERQQFFKNSHTLLGRLLMLKNVLHTLKIKNHILGQTPDHPKLYLWSETWNEQKLEEEKKNLITKKSKFDGPVPEAAINMKVCRKNLSDHLDEELSNFNKCLLEMETKIDDLDCDYESNDELVKIKEESSICNSEDESDSYVKGLLKLITHHLECV